MRPIYLGHLYLEWGFHSDSDIDIAFYSLRDKDLFKAIAFLNNELKRNVDVVQLEGHRLESYIKQKGLTWIR